MVEQVAVGAEFTDDHNRCIASILWYTDTKLTIAGMSPSLGVSRQEFTHKADDIRMVEVAQQFEFLDIHYTGLA